MSAIVLNFGLIARSKSYLRLFIFLIFTMIRIDVVGQAAYAGGGEGLRLNEINSHAARHFLNHFPQASGVKWVRDDHYDVACFDTDDSRTRVYYTSDGNFSFCLKYFPEGALNTGLSSTITKIFPGCRIGVVTELTDDLYKKSLFVHIKDGVYCKTLRCDDRGIEIMENIKDAGI